ncbi:MAG: ATP synthase subunit I [Woeseiaceae bacterium]|jgi:ATP synthase protein I
MDLTIPRVLTWQFVIGAALAAVLWVVYGNTAGYSALLGSLACVIPNAFLGLRLMVTRRDAKALLRAAWIGELIKLVLTVAIFTLVFALVRPLSPAALFAGFIMTQLVAFSGFMMRHDTETKTRKTNGS